MISVKRGTWGLKEWYPGRSFNKKGSEEPGEPSDGGIDDDQAPELISRERVLDVFEDANETNGPEQP